MFVAALAFVLAFPAAPQEGALFAPTLREEEAYSEAYTAVFDGDDGTYAITQLLLTNAGLGDGNVLCRALVVPPGGAGRNGVVRMGRADWTYDSTGDVLLAGGCRVGRSPEGFSLVADADGVRVELQLNRPGFVTKPPHHTVHAANGTFHSTELLAPWTPAELLATTVDGQGGPRRVRGKVTVDRARTNAMMLDVAAEWFRFRGQHGDAPVLVQIRMPPHHGKPEGWLWARGQQPVSVMNHQLAAGKDAWTWSVTTSGGTFTITRGTPIFRYRPAEQYGLLGKIARPFIGDPETRTYRGTLVGPDGQVTRGTLEHMRIQSGD
ncbi:MAG: hypothetical protein ACO3JL_02210 [Myxococcota bacterium]